MDNRIKWIDAAKGIAITAVVFGHISKNPQASAYVTSFNIPMFFFLSGFVFHFSKYPTLKMFVYTRARTLLLPHVYFSLISFIIWILHGYTGAHRGFSVPLTQPIVSFFYGNNVIYNGALWFLPCMFSVQIIFYLLRKFIPKTKILVVALFALLAWGFILTNILPFRLPWGIDVAFVAVVFYGIGHILSDEARLGPRLSSRIAMMVLPACLAVNVCFQILNGRIGMDQAVYGKLPYFCLATLSGIYFYSLLAQKLGSFPGLLFIGRNSLIVFVLHVVVSVPITVKFISWLTHLPEAELSRSVPWALLMTFLAIVIMYPFIFLINRYFPFLLGKGSPLGFSFDRKPR